MSPIDPNTRLTPYETRIYDLLIRLKRPYRDATWMRMAHNPSSHVHPSLLRRIIPSRAYPLTTSTHFSNLGSLAPTRVRIWRTRRGHLLIRTSGQFQYIDVGQLSELLTESEKAELFSSLKMMIKQQR